MAGLTDRLEAFDPAPNGLLHDISAESFHEVENVIRSFHATNDGVLSVLWVKMSARTRAFPNLNAGSPSKHAEIIQAELKHGLDKIYKLERSAPSITGL